MNNLNLTIIEQKYDQGRKFWVQQFNQYRGLNNATLISAGQLIWNDWSTPDNVFFELLPNLESLLFSLLTYIPNRAASPVVSSAPVPIQWNDTPSYETVSNRWNNVYIWNCADWQAWHEALEVHFKSTTTANGIWKSAWLHGDNECIALGIICPDTSYCRYDCDFVQYFASKNMAIGNLFSNAVCDLSNVVLNLTETVETTSESVKKTSKFISDSLPWAAGLGIMYGGAKLYKAF